MTKQGLKAAGAAAAVWALMVAGDGKAANAQSASAIPKLDVDQFTGTWYEVARLPNKAEKKCTSDAMVLYAEGDKPRRMQVVNTCRIKGDDVNVRNGRIKPAEKSGDGKYKLVYTWPFSSKYWVMATGPKYEWALVGNPNHKTLWLLSKTQQVSPELLGEMKSRAASDGFDVGKLVTVSQSQ